MTEVATWWYRPKGFTNFGDELGPEILKRLGHKPVRVIEEEAELITCGSVIEQVTHIRPGIRNPYPAIWGTGLMYDRTPKVKPRTIHAVRGALTARRIGLDPEDTILGDPGLLVPLLWERQPPRHRLGIVPHYVDTRTFPDADLIIDPTQPVDDVIAQITSCSTSASSSLHGLIVAEAFGIPAMRLPHQKVKGGDMKWLDYVSALDGPLDVIQDRLLKALPL